MSLRHKRFTLAPVGVDGSAVATLQWTYGKAGAIRFIAVDYVNQPVTTDLTIKADDVNGRTLFTKTNTNTDVPLTPVGMAGINPTGAVIAATDASAGGWPFYTGLYLSIAQGDGQVSGNERVIIDILFDA
jgi:hypothetical protein